MSVQQPVKVGRIREYSLQYLIGSFIGGEKIGAGQIIMLDIDLNTDAPLSFTVIMCFFCHYCLRDHFGKVLYHIILRICFPERDITV